ncbi:atp-binding cassette sub-family b [Holotrichia oblita]|nr:atp-binding cassette sub-family b [Holotrichia oblita]
MKRIITAYKDLLGIIFAEAPVMVVLTLICTVISGLLTPFGIYINQNVFDGGLSVASGEMAFSDYSIFLVLFAIIAILPTIISGIVFNYVQPRSLLILRTAYKARMLKKLKTMKYEHFESEESAEIIDKAYNRAENSARHMWPMYIYWRFSALIASIGTLVYVFNIRWWLLLTVLIPFFIETYISTKNNYNIYIELETYWKKERKYSTLGWYLRSRDFAKELKAFGNSDYLINTYKDRLNERNRDYERYYFKNLRKILMGSNITKIGSIANVIILLVLFVNGQMSVGLFIAMTGLMLGGIYGNLDSFAGFFKWSGMHINTYNYYDKFFKLSDESEGTETDLPKSFEIEFKDVWFKYPGTEKDILKGLSFKINNGEKASIVGENGEGKSTMIKLLLGLFSPDKGEILVGGKRLDEYPLSVRTKIFGPVFQDFPRYSITLKENIGIGNVDEIKNDEKIKAAARKGKADEFTEKFEKSYDTLLGRDFEGGVDISGGQWQRIAISRAFMGSKPILLLDEPTSQLDPMAEAALYNEFADMVENKTAIFITHRLGSTMITDRIFVISEGKIKRSRHA